MRIARRMEAAGASALEVSRGINLLVGMGTLHGRVPSDMILAWYPDMQGLPGIAKKVMRPILPWYMKEVKPAVRRYSVEAAKAIKRAVGIPVIVVGGIHDLSEVEQTIDGDGIDFVSMARPLVLEPNLVSKFATGKANKARCIECNHCIIGITAGPLKCWYGKVPDKM